MSSGPDQRELVRPTEVKGPRVLICGDRNWNCYECIDDFVKALPPESLIIEGEARGADVMSRQAGIKYGHQVQCFPAEWHIYGRAAGPRRNVQMVEIGKPERIVAFHNDIATSKGTAHMIKVAFMRGIPYEVRTCQHQQLRLEGGEREGHEGLHS